MNGESIQFLLLLDAIIFISAILMHIVKKNNAIVFLYVVQSLALFSLLISLAFRNNSATMFFVALATFIVKAVIAPIFLNNLIKKHHLQFSASNYLSTPIALLVLMALTALTYTKGFVVFADIFHKPQQLISLVAASIFISLFLMINRKGALSQIIGILSVENAIVFLVSVLGLEQTIGLELGILFDMLVWTIIAAIFISMIYKQFGTLDTSKMKRLTD